jgi:hypothetical protein
MHALTSRVSKVSVSVEEKRSSMELLKTRRGCPLE